MKIVWKQAQSRNIPKEVDTDSSPDTVYLRRNIVSKEDEVGVYYTYDEAQVDGAYKFPSITTTSLYLLALLDAAKAEKLGELSYAYDAANKKPIPFEQYFLLADWMTTYNNAYTSAQTDVEQGTQDSIEVLVLTSYGRLNTIQVETLSEFLPFIRTVSAEWRRLIAIRNRTMIAIQNSLSQEDLENIVINFEKGE